MNWWINHINTIKPRNQATRGEMLGKSTSRTFLIIAMNASKFNDFRECF